MLKKAAFLGIAVLLAVVFFYINRTRIELGFLALPSTPNTVDEVVFFKALINMHVKHNPFAFSFYNYGWLFFLSNYLLSLPWILTRHWEAVILTTRMLTSLFAVASWGVIYYTLRRQTASTWQAIAFSSLILLTPGFWKNANWFHPDWMMTFFLTLAAACLLMDKARIGRAYQLAIISLGLAVSSKFQALTYIVILIPIYWALVNGVSWQTRVNKSVVAGLEIAGIFFLTNPQLLVPVGWRLFQRVLVENLASNATNHGLGNHVLLSYKLNMIFSNYASPLTLLVFLMFCVAFAVQLLAKKRLWEFTQMQPALIALLLTISVNFLYLLFGVNKAWFAYYLPVFGLFYLVLPILLHQTFPSDNLKLKFIGVFLLLQIPFLLKVPNQYLLVSPSLAQSDNVTLKEDDQLLQSYFKKGLPASVVIGISPYIGFAWDHLGVAPQNLHVLMPPLSEALIQSTDYIILRPADLETASPGTRTAINKVFRPILQTPHLLMYCQKTTCKV